MDTTKSRLPEYQGFLNDETATIGELLGQNGYQTFMAGKWHVGSREREMWPDHHGFKSFYGTPDGGGLYFYPSKFYDRPVYHNGEKIKPPSSWYSTDGFTDATIDYIRNRKKGQPFFVYLAYIAPHFPLQAKKEDIDKYRDTYKAGYDVIRKARIARQKQSGIFPRSATASRPVCGDWDSVRDKDEEALKMAVYAAQIDCLDQNIGKLMAALKDEGLIDNTLVMFMSDNGGCSADFNKTPDAVIGSRDCNASYGIWYNVSNTPYRMEKTREHEGGIMTPLIMHWPAGIRQPGRMLSSPIHIMDVMPTCLELAAAAYPAEYRSRTLDPLDGRSLLPLLEEGDVDPGRVICWEHQGNRAVRKGDWKLVALHKMPWELYDLSKDPCEENGLIDTCPEKASELEKLYKTWANEHGVQPWPLKKER